MAKSNPILKSFKEITFVQGVMLTIWCIMLILNYNKERLCDNTYIYNTYEYHYSPTDSTYIEMANIKK